MNNYRKLTPKDIKILSWVKRACVRGRIPAVKYMYSNDGVLYGTNGHRVHRGELSIKLKDGYYNHKLEPVKEWNEKYQYPKKVFDAFDIRVDREARVDLTTGGILKFMHSLTTDRKFVVLNVGYAVGQIAFDYGYLMDIVGKNKIVRFKFNDWSYGDLTEFERGNLACYENHVLFKEPLGEALLMPVRERV